jgi:hypothetical protein
MRNELISFLRLKKLDRDVAPLASSSKKRRIKSREINANTFYVSRVPARATRSFSQEELVESFFVGSRASCTCLNVHLPRVRRTDTRRAFLLRAFNVASRTLLLLSCLVTGDHRKEQESIGAIARVSALVCRKCCRGKRLSVSLVSLK